MIDNINIPETSPPVNPFKAQSKVNPQLEDGYKRINNDVWAALTSARLPGSVYQIIFEIISRSWGFQRLSATISINQFIKATKLSHPGVRWAIGLAEKAQIIKVEHKHGFTSEYTFNKHYDTWLTRIVSYPSTEHYPSVEHNNELGQSSIRGCDSPLSGGVIVPKASASLTKETLKENIKEKNNKERENALSDNLTDEKMKGNEGDESQEEEEQKKADEYETWALNHEKKVLTHGILSEDEIEKESEKFMNLWEVEPNKKYNRGAYISWLQHAEDYKRNRPAAPNKLGLKKLPTCYTNPDEFDAPKKHYTRPEDLDSPRTKQLRDSIIRTGRLNEYKFKYNNNVFTETGHTIDEAKQKLSWNNDFDIDSISFAGEIN